MVINDDGGGSPLETSPKEVVLSRQRNADAVFKSTQPRFKREVSQASPGPGQYEQDPVRIGGNKLQASAAFRGGVSRNTGIDHSWLSG
jgi:hypothetical protein